MKTRYSPRTGVILGALLLAASPLGAQTQPTPAQPAAAGTATDNSKKLPSNSDIVTLGEFKVTSDRASVASAIEIKRNSNQIVDSIVADDITKLPDTNTAEALERVTGIQVGINTGEIGGNGGIAIRGLTQIENLIDGHEVFTAGGTSTGGVGAGTRTYDYSDLPSALVGEIDVYKTNQADQPEGGLGGSINVHLHKPFDFAMGPTAALTIGTTYQTLEGEDKPNQNILLSDTFNTGVGKMGILIDYAYDALPFREDTSGVGNPVVS
jgi:iron complex outermembrane receptor protein